MGILMLNFRIQYGLIHSLIDRLVYRLIIHSLIALSLGYPLRRDQMVSLMMRQKEMRRRENMVLKHMFTQMKRRRRKRIMMKRRFVMSVLNFLYSHRSSRTVNKQFFCICNLKDSLCMYIYQVLHGEILLDRRQHLINSKS